MRVTLVEGDAQRLPVPGDTFGVVSVAFGLRNVRDTVRGIDELIRVARPGGKVAILEFSRPRGRLLGRLYLTFFRHLLPRIGQALAPNDDHAYEYLPRSVLEFPDGQAMLELLGARTDRAGALSLDGRDRHPLSRDQGGAGRKGCVRGADSMTLKGSSDPDDLVVAMTGASGAAYAVRLLQWLCRIGRTIHVTISPSAVQVFREELDVALSVDAFDPAVLGCEGPGQVVYHHHQDFTAGIASGSFPTGGMVIVPCSMSTLGAIAAGITTNLITRAADVHLKERRKLILVPRETPLSLIHLENMVRVTPRRCRRLAGGARLVSPSDAPRGPHRLHREPGLRSARNRQHPHAKMGRTRPIRSGRDPARSQAGTGRDAS